MSTSEDCAVCQFASVCLSNPNFKLFTVRCTVCGAFRFYDVSTEHIMDLNGVPACMSLPRPRKTKCCKCKPGVYHGHVRPAFAKEREAQSVMLDIRFIFED